MILRWLPLWEKKKIVASTTLYFSLIRQEYYVGMYKVVGFFFFESGVLLKSVELASFEDICK